jgi:hypothetical protein
MESQRSQVLREGIKEKFCPRFAFLVCEDALRVRIVVMTGELRCLHADLSAQRIQFNGHYMELAGHGPWGGRRFSGLDGENKRGCRILDLILGGPFPGRRRRFREPIAQHCSTKQKAPGPRRGLILKQQGSAYRLAWRLAPPLGPLSGPLPRTSPVETSLTQSEPLPL